MFKQLLAITLSILLINLVAVTPVSANTKPEDAARFTEKVRGEIARLGTGPDARIEVRLRDKTKLKGYVSAADDTQFAVVNLKSGTTTTVPYSQVQKVKGNNLSTGARIAIGIGIVIGVLFLVAGICKVANRCQN